MDYTTHDPTYICVSMIATRHDLFLPEHIIGQSNITS